MEKDLFNNGVMKTENLQNRKGEWAFITALYNNQFRIDKKKSLRYRPETTKRLIANIGGKFSDIGLGKDFLNTN